MFQHVEAYAGDPILSLNEAFGKDPRSNKVNLSIGIYFDDAGKIPMLPSVRAAEQRVVAEAGIVPFCLWKARQISVVPCSNYCLALIAPQLLKAVL